MLKSAQFRVNDKKSRFELHLGDAIAYVEYIKEGNRIILFKTEIPESLTRIEGSINLLMSNILEFCTQLNAEMDIRCPFARGILSNQITSKGAT